MDFSLLFFFLSRAGGGQRAGFFAGDFRTQTDLHEARGGEMNRRDYDLVSGRSSYWLSDEVSLLFPVLTTVMRMQEGLIRPRGLWVLVESALASAISSDLFECAGVIVG